MRQYLTKFSTRAAYEVELSNLDFPNVSYISGDDELVYAESEPSPTHDYSQDYLTIEAIDDDVEISFAVSKGEEGVYYSTDSGGTWQALLTSVTINSGDKVMFKANLEVPTFDDDPYGIGKFSATGRFNVMGNPLSLILGEDDEFIGVTDLSDYYAPFHELFGDQSGGDNGSPVVSAENLALPFTTLSQSCYEGMFSFCHYIEVTPEMPATEMAEACYYGMFMGCTSLETAPELPATTLADSCYSAMFDSCTSLTTAPELPATTLADNCYNGMFYNCTSLETAPELLAPVLADGCYTEMFVDCSSLNYIKMTATELEEHALDTWVSGVAATGTFVKSASMEDLEEGVSGIPVGWAVLDA